MGNAICVFIWRGPAAEGPHIPAVESVSVFEPLLGLSRGAMKDQRILRAPEAAEAIARRPAYFRPVTSSRPHSSKGPQTPHELQVECTRPVDMFFIHSASAAMCMTNRQRHHIHAGYPIPEIYQLHANRRREDWGSMLPSMPQMWFHPEANRHCGVGAQGKMPTSR